MMVLVYTTVGCWGSSLTVYMYAVPRNQAFQHFVGNPMGTNWIPLLVDLSLFYYEAEFISKILHEKTKICFSGNLDMSKFYLLTTLINISIQ